MKNMKKCIAFSLAAAVLTGTISLPAAAFPLYVDEQPLALVFEEMEADTDSYFKHDVSSFQYLSEDMFYLAHITKLSYEIQLDNAVMPQSSVDELKQIIKSEYWSNEMQTKDVQSEMKNSVYLQDCGNGKYLLVCQGTTSCFPHQPDEEKLLQYLQQNPAFVSVKKEILGYSASDLLNGIYAGYFPIGAQSAQLLTIDVKDGVTLKASDFPPECGIIDVTKVYDIERPDVELETNEYWLEFDTSAYAETGIQPAQMLNLIKKIQTVDGVEDVDLKVSCDEPGFAGDPSKGEGFVQFLTRGDCDRDGSITMQDAYQALLCNSAASMGETPVLSDRGQQAADTDGDGAVSASDAYRILKYTSYEALGTEASWTEILES